MGEVGSEWRKRVVRVCVGWGPCVRPCVRPNPARRIAVHSEAGTWRTQYGCVGGGWGVGEVVGGGGGGE